MYIALAFKNFRKNVMEYSLYLITLTFLAAVMYAFFSLSFSKIFLSLSENLIYFSNIIFIITIFISFIGFLVVRYSVRAMTERRDKEFRIYSMLGMSSKNIILMICMEHFLLNILALVFGIFCGVLLNAPLTKLVLQLFDAHKYSLQFSSLAVIYTSICYLCFYIASIFGTISVMRKRYIFKRYRKGEKGHVVSLISGIVFFFCSALLLFYGMEDPEERLLFLGIAVSLLFIGVYLFYNNVCKVMILSKTLTEKWKSRNLYFGANSIKKFMENGRKNAVNSLLIMATLTTMSLAIAMGNIYRINLETFYPYDIEVLFDTAVTTESMKEIETYVASNIKMQDKRTYYLYTNEHIRGVSILCLSDYNYLRRQIGLDEKTIEDNQFIVHCEERRYLDEIDKNIEANPGIQIGKWKLKTSSKLIFSEAMEQAQAAGRNGYAIIVPDKFKEYMNPVETRLIITAQGNVAPTFKEELSKYINYKWKSGKQEISNNAHQGNGSLFYGVVVKSWSERNSMAGFTMIAFGGIYFSICILILVGSILAFQQYLGMKQSITDYKILSAIGVGWKEWKKEIKLEILLNFMFPAIIPFIEITYIMLVLQIKYKFYFLTNRFILLESVMITLFIYIFIHVCFMLGTYNTYKKVFVKESGAM